MACRRPTASRADRARGPLACASSRSHRTIPGSEKPVRRWPVHLPLQGAQEHRLGIGEARPKKQAMPDPSSQLAAISRGLSRSAVAKSASADSGRPAQTFSQALVAQPRVKLGLSARARSTKAMAGSISSLEYPESIVTGALQGTPRKVDGFRTAGFGCVRPMTEMQIGLTGRRQRQRRSEMRIALDRAPQQVKGGTRTVPVPCPGE